MASLACNVYINLHGQIDSKWKTNNFYISADDRQREINSRLFTEDDD